MFRRELLGVLGVFSRMTLDDEAIEWSRMFASHAAVSIANARAFVELDELCSQLELEIENAHLREEIRQTGLGCSGSKKPAHVDRGSETRNAAPNACEPSTSSEVDADPAVQAMSPPAVPGTVGGAGSSAEASLTREPLPLRKRQAVRPRAADVVDPAADRDNFRD